MSVIAAPVSRDSLWSAALRSPNFLIGAAITLVFVLVALVSFVWTPYDYLLQNIPNKLKPPSAEHWFGTDAFGRDICSRRVSCPLNRTGGVAITPPSEPPG